MLLFCYYFLKYSTFDNGSERVADSLNGNHSMLFYFTFDYFFNRKNICILFCLTYIRSFLLRFLLIKLIFYIITGYTINGGNTGDFLIVKICYKLALLLSRYSNDFTDQCGFKKMFNSILLTAVSFVLLVK